MMYFFKYTQTENQKSDFLTLTYLGQICLFYGICYVYMSTTYSINNINKVG